MTEADQRSREREARMKERFRRKSSHTSIRYLRRMKELGGAPEEFTPFMETLDRIYTGMESADIPADVPAVGTYCVMAPQELIYAAGAQPVKLCSGSYTAFSVGDGEVPRDACPLVKAAEGFMSADTMPLRMFAVQTPLTPKKGVRIRENTETFTSPSIRERM